MDIPSDAVFYSLAVHYTTESDLPPNYSAPELLIDYGVEFFARKGDKGRDIVVVNFYDGEKRISKGTFRIPDEEKGLIALIDDIKDSDLQPHTLWAVDEEEFRHVDLRKLDRIE